MIDNDFHWWTPRYVRWCPSCHERECNGRNDLCARCMGEIALEVDRMLEGVFDA